MMRLALITFGCLLLAPAAARAAEPVDYRKQIRPIFQERCYACHGALNQNSKLRLDSGAGMLARGVVVPGNFRYRSSAGGWRYGHKISKQSNQKFAASYVTGSHALKVGFQIMEGWRHFFQEPNGSLDYNFSNGLPLSLTEWATPLLDEERLFSMLKRSIA